MGPIRVRQRGADPTAKIEKNQAGRSTRRAEPTYHGGASPNPRYDAAEMGQTHEGKRVPERTGSGYGEINEDIWFTTPKPRKWKGKRENRWRG